MVPKHYLEFLAGLPNSQGPHSSKSLLDHLQGTFAILKRWQSPEHVCAAGLFHSVYGTRAYHSITLDPSSRGMLRNLIGDEAEALVHAFHLANWSDILRDGACAAVAAQASPGIFEIAIANLVEQVPRVAVSTKDEGSLYQAAKAHLALEPWLSVAAGGDLRQLLAAPIWQPARRSVSGRGK